MGRSLKQAVVNTHHIRLQPVLLVHEHKGKDVEGKMLFELAVVDTGVTCSSSRTLVTRHRRLAGLWS